MKNTFFNDTHSTARIPNCMTEEQINLALRTISGLKIISINHQLLEFFCNNTRINGEFIEKYLIDYQIRKDIENKLNINTSDLVQNIINESLGAKK